MATDRLDILKQMVAQDANNSFARYGLGMEYVKTGEFQQAVAEFRVLLAAEAIEARARELAETLASHAPITLRVTKEAVRRIQEARTMYEQGIEATTRTGDAHTRAEIEGALNLLPV